ncbi:MAG: hypothetical protein ACKVP7_09835 [Hyphomicrobiaceae bacterium]
MGRLPVNMTGETVTTSELELAPQDYDATLGTLMTAAKRGTWLFADGKTRSGLKFPFDAVVELATLKQQQRGAATQGKRVSEHLEFTITCQLPSRRQTVMTVTLRIDTNGRCWINLRANPTPFLAGHNAFAVALEGQSPRDELRCLLRLPFEALTAVLRCINPEFMWSSITNRRMRALLFRLTNIQIFTYLAVPNGERGKLLGYLRCMMSVPFGDGRGRYRLLADALNVRFDTRHSAADVQTLLFVCLVGGRAAVSVNLYEKDAKVGADDRMAKGCALGLSEYALLKDVIRLDLTLHEPALRELFREARIGNKTDTALMAANFVKAVRRLDLGKGRSGKTCLAWLLDYTFDQRLPLQKLLNFRPSLLEKARRVLKSYNPQAALVFRAWWREAPATRGDRGSFVLFAMRHASFKLSREQARKTRSKLLALGLDPDIPGDVYEAFYAQTFVWDMPRVERTKFCKALQARDGEVIAKYMARSRARSATKIDEVAATIRQMLESAEVPAVAVGPSASKAAVALPKSSSSKVARSRTVNEEQRGIRNINLTSA